MMYQNKIWVNDVYTTIMLYTFFLPFYNLFIKKNYLININQQLFIKIKFLSDQIYNLTKIILVKKLYIFNYL